MIREIGRERENKNRTLFEQNQQTLFNQQPVHVTLVHISSWDQLKTTKNRSGPLTNFGGCSQPCDAEVVRRKDNKKTKKEIGWKTSDYAVGAFAFRNIGRRGGTAFRRESISAERAWLITPMVMNVAFFYLFLVLSCSFLSVCTKMFSFEISSGTFGLPNVPPRAGRKIKHQQKEFLIVVKLFFGVPAISAV